MKTTTDNMLKFANEFIERNDITDYELSIQHNSLIRIFDSRQSMRNCDDSLITKQLQ